MTRKQRFPPEASTRPEHGSKPGLTHQSGPAPKGKRERAEAPTEPPPPPSKKPSRAPKPGASDVRRVKAAPAAATVDEVTADLTRDPRREKDSDE